MRQRLRCRRSPSLVAGHLEEERIHRKDALEIYSFDPGFIGALVEMLERRTAMTVSVSDRQGYVTIGDGTAEGEVKPHRLGEER